MLELVADVLAKVGGLVRDLFGLFQLGEPLLRFIFLIFLRFEGFLGGVDGQSFLGGW